jgi:hypothetical protein
MLLLLLMMMIHTGSDNIRCSFNTGNAHNFKRALPPYSCHMNFVAARLVAIAAHPNVCIRCVESTQICLIVIHIGTFYLDR